MIEADPPEPPARERSARVTLSRTWELELFISGATVFALMQAPRLVDAWYAGIDPHLVGRVSMAAFFGYYYAKLSLYTLIATFVLHLITRAYWVGLVGLHSIYPEGVRWEALGYGPAFLGEFQKRLPSLEAVIRRADDISSLLFSGGAVILLWFLSSIVFVGVLVLVAVAISWLFFSGEQALLIGVGVMTVIALVPSIAKSLDARQARKHGAAARPGRVLKKLAVAAYHLSFMPIVGPLSLVIASNLGKRKAGWALSLSFLAIIGTFIARDVVPRTGALRADGHVYVPDRRATQELLPAYYADRRAAGVVYTGTPAIQSEIIRDAYIRLFVPVTPDRHNAVIAALCPEVPGYARGFRVVDPRPPTQLADVAQLLDCLARLHPVSINGEPLEALVYRLTVDEASGVRGVAAFIPVTGLEPGEHVLRVEALPRLARRGPGTLEARAPHLIRFWL